MNFYQNRCICGSTKSTSMFKAKDHNFKTTNYISDIKKCNSCGSIFPDVFPDSNSLDSAYSEYYTRELTSGAMTLKRKFLRYLQGEFSYRSLKPGLNNLLDYGCGSGDFLLEIQKMQPECTLYGSDISTPPEGYKDYFKFYENKNLNNIKEKFENITMSHVIEHVENPIDTLTSFLGIMEDNCSVWIATPNANSFLINEFGEHARDIDFPRHRLIFSYENMKDTLERCGYDCRFIVPPLVNTFMCFFQCLRNLINDKTLPFHSRLWRSVCSIFNLVNKHLIFNKKNLHTRSEIICIASKKK
jgi:SAM-dependent methyltransferase